MNNFCKAVVFSDRAYNAIIRETFEWEPVETGGILLGHILDNGYWVVMEVLPPGFSENREGDNVHHDLAYFEYNQRFVNYLVKPIAEQYETPLEVLGLWHRHPGSMDCFSGTDDRTNSTFASLNPRGVISGLVNVDPNLRMSMYYLPHSESQTYGRPQYEVVDVEVGSDLIPEDFFRLKFYNGEGSNLHPRFSSEVKKTSNKDSDIPKQSEESKNDQPTQSKSKTWAEWSERFKKKDDTITRGINSCVSFFFDSCL